MAGTNHASKISMDFSKLEAHVQYENGSTFDTEWPLVVFRVANSPRITKVTYDPYDENMRIHYKGGRVETYEHIPGDLFICLTLSECVDHFVSMYITCNYKPSLVA